MNSFPTHSSSLARRELRSLLSSCLSLRLLLCLLLCLFLCAAGSRPLSATEPDLASERPSRAPRMDGFSPLESSRLRSALQLARARLAKNERCAELFENLDHDGATLLSQARFEDPSPLEARQICRRNVALFTTIGGRRISVCAGAFELERRTLASLLVHEALHLGGQPESPAVQGAPSSGELTRRVRKACSL